jgi:hypothetical protein
MDWATFWVIFFTNPSGHHEVEGYLKLLVQRGPHRKWLNFNCKSSHPLNSEFKFPRIEILQNDKFNLNLSFFITSGIPESIFFKWRVICNCRYLTLIWRSSFFIFLCSRFFYFLSQIFRIFRHSSSIGENGGRQMWQFYSASYLYICTTWSWFPAQGWPDWANFRPMGDCLLWTIFLNVTKVAYIFGLLFSPVKARH